MCIVLCRIYRAVSLKWIILIFDYLFFQCRENPNKFFLTYNYIVKRSPTDKIFRNFFSNSENREKIILKNTT